MNKKLVLIIFIIVIILGMGIFVTKNSEKKSGISNGDFVSVMKKFNLARADNKNIVGWIKINNTNIDYAVNLGSLINNNLSDDTIWTNDTLSNGKNRKVIFGHNLLNVSSRPLVNDKRLSRFEPLMSYVYQDFTEEHLYIQYVDIDSEESLYKIYAVSFYETNDDLGESYTNKEDINNYIKTVKSNSIYDFGVDVNYKDDLITLSTCTRFFGVKGPTHFKIDARRVRKNEKIEKYSVKKSCNYDIMNKE